ncbi:hypothetical protein CPB83DRAFT_742139, partial [Crepidotus variabilis]
MLAMATTPSPNYGFGVGNVQSLGGGYNRWNVYDGNCRVVDGLTTNGNPCTQGMFGCSPPPIKFNRYTSSYNGGVYSCYPDSSAENCGNDPVSVCVSSNGS